MRPDLLLRHVVLGACLAAGLWRLPVTVDHVRYDNARGAGVPDVHGVPAVGGTPEGMPDLFAKVRELVPGDEAVRLVVNDTNCVSLPTRAGGATLFWAQYHLLPHPVTCDPGARWWVLVGDPQRPPPGAEVFQVRRNLALVRTR